MNGQSTATNRRFVRWSVLVSMLLAIALVAGVWLYVQRRPSIMAGAARDAAFEERFDEMLLELEALSALDDREQYYQAVLTCAEIADYHGKHDLALDVLALPQPAQDPLYAAFSEQAQQKDMVYRYHQALELYETGDYARAARAAAQLRQYEPAQKLYDLAQNAYQASIATPVPTATPAPTPAPVETQQPTETMQPFSLLPEGRLAAGFEHTVVLLDDGTVRAFGQNNYGQLDVESWSNVVYVAAGAYHTLGLTADGRVLACGDNTHLQSDVTFYSNVKSIACGDYASFLLLESGQVMAAGYLGYEFLNDLPPAQRIWAGSYGLLVQTADGLHASHPGLALDGPCAAAAVSRGYAIRADETGSTAATTQLIPAWTGVKRLTAGENAVLGICEDGSVVSHMFDRHSRCSFSFDQPVLAAAAGPNHYAFVLLDGTLQIRTADGETENHSLN